MNYPVGWECPRCHKINSPHINQCDCLNSEIKPKKEEIVIDFSKFKTAEELKKELERIGIKAKEPDEDPFDALNNLKPEHLRSSFFGRKTKFHL